MKQETYNLKDVVERFVNSFPNITEIRLFGSRRYGTQSPRSDVDLLVCHSGHIRPAEVRNIAKLICPALDPFLVQGAKAISCMNESYVEADSLENLISRLGAVLIWRSGQGHIDADITWEFSLPVGVDFPPTAIMTPSELPFTWARSVQSFLTYLSEQGLPTLPYIGASANDIAEFFKQLLVRMVSYIAAFTPRGKGITMKFLSEYDFQDAFFICVKPWLPELGREEVVIVYDEQEKRADFNICDSQIIFEMKHVRDAGTKAAIVKTLEGLRLFYKRHPNVQVLVFAILVDASVKLDKARWETDFSYENDKTTVKTVVVQIPSPLSR